MSRVEHKSLNGRLGLFLLIQSLWVSPLAGLVSIPDTFDDLHGSTHFPVIGKSFEDVESAFGPRHQTSTGLYDWHRGIDIDGVEGDSIVAAYDGVFYDYRYTDRGGYIVILRHELPTQSSPNLLGSTTSRVFYT